MNDIELLQAELDVLWGLNERGRLTREVDFVVAIATSGAVATAAAEHLPDPMATTLADLVDNAPPITDPRTPPPVMAQCAGVLAASGATLSGGPSYLVPPSVRHSATFPILRSDRDEASTLLTMRPSNWAPEEWAELVRGGEGAPWAMVVVDRQVVSICHTPRRTARGAEAGTWTDPSFRSRGLAAAATAAWAQVAAVDSPCLFYSTSADNASSQRVARRLQLPEIGWLWKLTRP